MWKRNPPDEGNIGTFVAETQLDPGDVLQREEDITMVDEHDTRVLFIAPSSEKMALTILCSSYGTVEEQGKSPSCVTC